MKIAEIKRKYKNKWVLLEVVKMSDVNQIEEANLIWASDNKDEVYERAKKVEEGKTIATFYTGRLTGTYAL